MSILQLYNDKTKLKGVKLDGWVVYYTVNFEPIKVINNIRNSPTPEVDESAEVDPYEDGVYH